jgi:hypothetical protein
LRRYKRNRFWVKANVTFRRQVLAPLVGAFLVNELQIENMAVAGLIYVLLIAIFFNGIIEFIKDFYKYYIKEQ